jgi:riboflavin-specific deaminase-like protein
LTEKATRLYPLPPREIPADAIYHDLELPPPQHRDATRPYVVINMVSSLDGKTTLDGKASDLGTRADRQAMRNLRSKADAVMVGAKTLRAEKLSLGLDEPPPARQPLAIILTNSGEDLPLESNLVAHERQQLLVIAPRGAALHLPEHVGRTLLVPRAGRGANLKEMLRTLSAEYAIDLLVVEGGPTLNHSLISAHLADELFLTLAPRLLGGVPQDSLTILDGPRLPSRAECLKLLSVQLCCDQLFLRYTFDRIIQQT